MVGSRRSCQRSSQQTDTGTLKGFFVIAHLPFGEFIHEVILKCGGFVCWRDDETMKTENKVFRLFTVNTDQICIFLRDQDNDPIRHHHLIWVK